MVANVDADAPARPDWPSHAAAEDADSGARRLHITDVQRISLADIEDQGGVRADNARGWTITGRPAYTTAAKNVRDHAPDGRQIPRYRTGRQHLSKIALADFD